MGCIVNAFHKGRVSELLRDHQGTTLLGNPNAFDDGELTPTVVLNPSPDSALMREEIFGPVLPVISFQRFDEVIAHINKNDKPLAIYYFGHVWSANRTRLERETSSGSLVTNETLFQIANPDLPFGGVGGSGYGRYHGLAGFKAFSNPKTIVTKLPLNVYPYNKVYAPFTKDKQGLIRFLMKWLSMSQKQFFKRLIWLLIILYFAKKILTGELSMKTYRKWKNIFGMVGGMLPMLMK